MTNVERRTATAHRHAWSFVVRGSTFVVASALVFSFQFSVFSFPQEPSFRSGSSELVVLPVVVTDRQGRFVSDVPGDHFTIFDNGRRVPIELFSNEDTPVTIGLILDASSSMRPKLGELIAATMTFARTSNPQDELFAIRFNDDVQDVLPDRSFLLASDTSALESAVRSVRADGRTALYDGLMAGLDHLEKGSRARRAVVVRRDGGENPTAAKRDAGPPRARDLHRPIYKLGGEAPDDPETDP